MKPFSLSIPKPCHENWNTMTPQDRGRFCGACQKTVVDFTAMSDRQMADFFKRPAGSVCGRFHTDQLNRVVEPPRKRLPWIKHFFTIALPAMLVTAKATAQGQPMLGKVAMYDDRLKGDTVVKPVELPVWQTIRGMVRDENGSPMAGVNVVEVETKAGTVSHNDGGFQLKVKQKDSVVMLEVSCVGYKLKQVRVKAGEAAVIEMKTADMMIQGEIMVVVEKKQKKAKPSLLKNSAASSLSVYPNPIASAATLTLNTEKLLPGSYNLSIANNAGVALQTDELLLAKGMKTFLVQLQQLPAGTNFISLINKTTGKMLTQQLLVQ